MRRKLAWTAAAVLAAYAVVVWIASSMFMHVRGSKPRKEPPTPGLTEIAAVTQDGLTLRGSFLEPADARGVVVLFHGIGCERYRATLPKIAAWGFVGVSFDFRCHGTSDGDVTTFGWNERLDVAAIVSAVRSRWPGLKIALWGISLGGAALCYAAEIARDADAVVLESVYRDIDRRSSGGSRHTRPSGPSRPQSRRSGSPRPAWRSTRPNCVPRFSRHSCAPTGPSS